MPIIFLFAACSTKKKDSLDTENRIVFTDTSLLKAANGTTDVAANNIEAPALVAEKAQPKVQIRTITRVVHVRDKQPLPKVIEKVEPPVVVAPTQTTIPASTTTGTASTGIGTGNPGTGATTKPIEKKKNEGWSGAAKGATIGGVGGAVAGAILGKGGKGAIIGGVIGAAGGYILGRKADKKSGRIDYTYN